MLRTHLHQPLRMRVWQWTQEDRVHNAEYGSVRADAQGQGDHHCRMQSWLFGEHAHAEANIATPLSRRKHAPLPSLPLFQLSDVAELTAGCTGRMFDAHSLRSIVLRQERNVLTDFVAERIVLAALHRLPLQFRPHGSQSAHRVTPVSRASACAP